MSGAPQLCWIEAELLHKVSFGRNGVTGDEFIQTLREQFGDRRYVAALGGVMVSRVREVRSGLKFDIARKQLSVSSSASVLLWAWSWCVDSHGLRGAVSWASEREQTWSLFESFAKLLEFASVEPEGSVIPLVRLTIPWAFDRVHK